MRVKAALFADFVVANRFFHFFVIFGIDFFWLRN